MPEVNRILELKSRFQTIEIQRAKLEERKTVAAEAVKKAKVKLKELGFNFTTAEKEIERLYEACVVDIEDLEELLGISIN